MARLGVSTLSHFEIREPLGAGGMGDVYLAVDTRLGRRVALKVLPPELAEDRGRLARFEAEARALAALNHPNIVTIYSVECVDEINFLSMELVQGTTLAGLINDRGLPLDRLLQLAIPLTDALAAAHAQGIIHRDLKPANVMLTTTGTLKVLDFGLARQSQDTASESSELVTASVTTPGTVLGTVPYMSPEQLAGKLVDHRSDLFSLGVLLFELATGKRPFSGASHAELMSSILRDEPPPVAALRPDLAGGLGPIINACLEKDPEKRWQTAAEIREALEELHRGMTTTTSAPRIPARMLQLGSVLIVVAAATLLLLFVPSSRGPGPKEAAPKRIAVLPFANVGAPEDDHLVDGITDEVRSKLSRLECLQVIARASSDRFRDSTASPEDIAAALDVSYLLTATVRWQTQAHGPRRIRVNPELVEVTDRGPPPVLWSEPFNASLEDVFQVQAELASKVAQALDLTVGKGAPAALSERPPTTNMDAYETYLRAVRLLRDEGYGIVTLREATALLERTVALDPTFAEAWAQLSIDHSLVFMWVEPTTTRGDAAKHAALRALELAPDLPHAHHAMGMYWQIVHSDDERSAAALRRGLELDPGDVDILNSLAAMQLWSSMGCHKEVLDVLDRIQTLDPLSSGVDEMRSFILSALGRFQEARQAADRACSLAPKSISAVSYMTYALLAQGELEEARSVLRQASDRVDTLELLATIATMWDRYWVLDEEWQALLLRLGPEPFGQDEAGRQIAFAHTCYLRGDHRQTRVHAALAATALETMLADRPDAQQPCSLMATAQAYLGNRSEALRYGRNAVELAESVHGKVWQAYARSQLIRAHLILGDTEAALDQLEILVEEPWPFTTPQWLSIEPMYAPLKGHPRFAALLERTEVGARSAVP